MARKDGLYDRDIFCPFYHGTKNKTTVCCEGPYAKTYISLTFRTKNAFAAHRQQYCNGKGCEGCRVYKCVMEQYGEE